MEDCPLEPLAMPVDLRKHFDPRSGCQVIKDLNAGNFEKYKFVESLSQVDKDCIEVRDKNTVIPFLDPVIDDNLLTLQAVKTPILSMKAIKGTQVDGSTMKIIKKAREGLYFQKISLQTTKKSPKLGFTGFKNHILQYRFIELKDGVYSLSPKAVYYETYMEVRIKRPREEITDTASMTDSHFSSSWSDRNKSIETLILEKHTDQLTCLHLLTSSLP